MSCLQECACSPAEASDCIPCIAAPKCYSPLLPAGPWLEQHAKPGRGDTRIGKAVFLGGPNGWAGGARRAMLRAARLFPELFHVDLYSIPENDLQLHPDHNLTILGLPRLSLQEQTDHFKYVIYAPGHCASTRLRQELSSASAVFMVITHEMEWCAFLGYAVLCFMEMHSCASSGITLYSSPTSITYPSHWTQLDLTTLEVLMPCSR